MYGLAFGCRERIGWLPFQLNRNSWRKWEEKKSWPKECATVKTNRHLPKWKLRECGIKARKDSGKCKKNNKEFRMGRNNEEFKGMRNEMWKQLNKQTKYDNIFACSWCLITDEYVFYLPTVIDRMKDCLQSKICKTLHFVNVCLPTNLWALRCAVCHNKRLTNEIFEIDLIVVGFSGAGWVERSVQCDAWSANAFSNSNESMFYSIRIRLNVVRKSFWLVCFHISMFLCWMCKVTYTFEYTACLYLCILNKCLVLAMTMWRIDATIWFHCIQVRAINDNIVQFQLLHSNHLERIWIEYSQLKHTKSNVIPNSWMIFVYIRHTKPWMKSTKIDIFVLVH